MEAVSIANNYEENYLKNERESLFFPPSVMPEKIFQSENDPLRFCRGLIFGLPVSLLLWGIIIWVFL